MTDQTVGPSDRQAVLLGIDCGGSHTAVVVGDSGGRVLSRAEGPGSGIFTAPRHGVN
jgi:N-acetylglucosamine kinase-like BadF-type ATPase